MREKKESFVSHLEDNRDPLKGSKQGRDDGIVAPEEQGGVTGNAGVSGLEN